jgi:hypothetical protein
MTKVLKYFKYIFIIFLVCIVSVYVPIAGYKKLHKTELVETNNYPVLRVWEIDAFEGGKGSRTGYIQNLAFAFSKKNFCSILVTTISSDSARENIQNGNIPDIISFGAGMYGIENYIEKFSTWCYGEYCLLSLGKNIDFSLANSENTYVSGGIENLYDLVALFYGLDEAKVVDRTSVYVKLINGECKFLLGTQRDVFRLKTRGIDFSVQPLNLFSDLYQNISVTNVCNESALANNFIKFVLSKSEEITKLGLFYEGKKLYSDELQNFENLEIEYKLDFPVTESVYKNIKNYIAQKDINSLKKLLK